ncbi:MAG: hypothetical protein SGJ20_07780 [Planctomycetota bacterium]|nr:hypothetical protein [Planctomycetota bacterium]
MAQRFSERYGHRTARIAIQIEDVDEVLRNRLWTVLDLVLWRGSEREKWLPDASNGDLRPILIRLWFQHFKRPTDEIEDYWPTVLQQLRKYFFGCKWFDVYDFVEFIAAELPDARSFKKLCNAVLEEEKSGYRFVGNGIAQITSASEIGAIENAQETSDKEVRAHVDRAVALLSDRKAPDYRNSIKESISAVESLVSKTVGTKGTLGQLLKQLEGEIHLHPALKGAFSQLYGYTSDENGVRHAERDHLIRCCDIQV